MRIDTPTPGQLPALRRLWQRVFGDSDRFLDDFYSTAFSPDRCRCITLDTLPVAALYWFDVFCQGQKMAYLYAVATDPVFRGRGLCRALMESTRLQLTESGYHAILLSPENEPLVGMYEKMGYRCCTTASEYTCEADGNAADLRILSRSEYARLRRAYLPHGGVIQEQENLAFLETMSTFYAGDSFLLSARVQDGALWGDELLGNAAAAPGILKALGLPRGSFRISGNEKLLTMILPLTPEAVAPVWFGLPFD